MIPLMAKPTIAKVRLASRLRSTTRSSQHNRLGQLRQNRAGEPGGNPGKHHASALFEIRKLGADAADVVVGVVTQHEQESRRLQKNERPPVSSDRRNTGGEKSLESDAGWRRKYVGHLILQ